MNNTLLHLFSNYMTTEYYSNISSDLNLDWLYDKLSIKDLEDLKEQIYTILLRNEEEIFISTLKYAWHMHQELLTM